MCGIAGVFLPQKENKLNVVKCMTDALIHRGPDGEGHWNSQSAGVTLGHRRLAILDLTENAKQPMHFNNRYTIVFNGEIYNYVEIRKQLVKEGYNFKSNSDTEVILALYDKKKEDCLADLEGMFAFALWDEEQQSLFCARDRFGEKPFFYYFDRDKGFYFASEMKALWAVGIPREPNVNLLHLFLESGVCLHPTDQTKTFYNGIKQLDSGQYLKISSNSFTPIVKKYYSLDNLEINRDISFDEAKDKFRALFSESINRRLRSDVAIGSSLSGGIDSSSIVLMINSMKAQNSIQKTFSARFSNFKKDEGEFIKEVISKSNDILSHEVWPNGDDFNNSLDKIIFHQEEPFGSASIFAQWKVLELAKKCGVTVMLDGQGADEHLAGYLHYYNVYLSQLYQNDYNTFLQEVENYRIRRNIIHPLHPDRQTIKHKLGRIKRKISKNTISINNSNLSNTLKNDLMVTGLKELLRYADRNSMAHSVEVRLPYLDHNLVEFVVQMPDNYKLNQAWTKLLLRKSMEDILPPKITWRVDKIAYETPQNNWLSNIKNSVQTKVILEYFNDFGISIKEKDIDNTSDWNYYLTSKYI